MKKSTQEIVRRTRGRDTVNGGNGNDIVAGQTGDPLTGAGQLLSGGLGTDMLLGGNGNDTLIGGAGNDLLHGGAGNDTYVFNAGDGNDTVLETFGDSGIDALQFGTGITVGDISIAQEGDALVFRNNGGGSVTVARWFASDSNKLDTVTFADGRSFDLAALLLGGADADVLTAPGGVPLNQILSGAAGNDTLIGGDGNDWLTGGTGSDQMAGGLGDDSYVVDSSGDVVTELVGEGTDTVFAQVSMTLSANVENLTLTGTSGLSGTGNELDNALAGNGAANALYGLDGNDILTGNDGNDTLDGGAGADQMGGGTGNDSYVVDNAGDVVTENANEGTDTVYTNLAYTLGQNLENLTLTGTDSIDGTGNELNNILSGNSADNTLSGLAGNDTLAGGAGSDTLTGGDGTDQLDGGTGTDQMTGGAGNDTYAVDNASDTVTENLNEGTDTVQSSIAYTLADNIENLTLTGSANIDGTGNTLDNVLTGNAADNILLGLEGNDTLNGGTGADTMLGGTGNDTYAVDNTSDTVTENLSEGTDTVQSSITYTLGSDVENLTLTGTGNIDGTGNALDNVIVGSNVTRVNNTFIGGNNILDGGAGADTMMGGTGNDTYILDSVGDAVIENANEGTDTVISLLDYTLGANVENLTLTEGAALAGTGNELGNTLTGNSNDNTLTGLAGNDTLDGGAGADTMLGGADNDTYAVDNASDIVTENLNEGTDTVQSSITYTLTENVENLTLTGSANIDGTGNELNNVLTGNSGANILTGLAGSDTYVVDNIGDVVVENASEGTDTVQSGITYTLTDNVENLTLTGSANIDGTGNALDNVLTGNSGANILTGLAGSDTYVVDNIGDMVAENASEGTDTVQSGITYTLADNIENLTLTGSANINGTGNALDNVITGNSGSNTLDGGAGTDTLLGGAGNDTYIVDNAGDTVTENSGQGTDIVQSGITYTLSDNVENLTLTGSDNIDGTGNTLDNILTGNTADNILLGLEGNDTLNGGTGADTLLGGAGNDTYAVDNASDTVTENLNEGTDTVQSSITYTLSDNVENLTLTGNGNIDGTGNALDNVITGTSANNMLDGGAGADILMGGGGDDTYVVNNTGVVVIENANAGTDTVQSSISYTLGSNVENLILTGIADIAATGNALDNVITGNSGANTLTGLAGNDTYVVDNAGDMVAENLNEGIDLVQSSVTFTLSDNVENLTLTGTADINATGNGLDNLITGNSGANAMTGLAGNDTYVVDNAGDIVTENLNEGIDLVQSGVTFTLSDNVENLTLTGTGNIDGTGNALDNVIIGNSGANAMTGLAGNDTYVVDNAGDMVAENLNEGIDLVQSSVAFTLSDNVENLTLTGTSNIDGTGNALDNAIIGNSGANILTGLAGSDTYVVDNIGDVVVENASEGTDTVQSSITYTLTDNVENLTLTDNSNFNMDGTGNALNNVITGNSANNTLDGGAGADILMGGGGDDTYVVNNTGVVVIENANAGTDTVQASLTYTLGSNVENLILTGIADINATGNALDNAITGNSGANILTGLAGSDTYVVDNIGDVVVENASEGTDTVQSSITYTLTDHVENLTLTGNSNFNMDGTGNALDNVITGNIGNNTLDGGVGAAVGDLFDLRRLMGDTLEAAGWDGIALLGDWAATDAGDAANDVVWRKSA